MPCLGLWYHPVCCFIVDNGLCKFPLQVLILSTEPSPGYRSQCCHAVASVALVCSLNLILEILQCLLIHMKVPDISYGLVVSWTVLPGSWAAYWSCVLGCILRKPLTCDLIQHWLECNQYCSFNVRFDLKENDWFTGHYFKKLATLRLCPLACIIFSVKELVDVGPSLFLMVL